MQITKKNKYGAKTAEYGAKSSEKKEYHLVIERVMDKYGYLCCEECSSNKWLEIHHIIKRSQGGKHNKENLKLLCKVCHEKKHGQKLIFI